MRSSQPTPSPLAADAMLRVLAYLLDGQPWLREKLAGFAGAAIHVEAAPFSFMLRIAQSGDLEPAPEDLAADVKLVLTPIALARYLGGDEAARRDLRFEGDSALAHTLGAVARELRWDAEEDLSRVVGDIAARRLVTLGRALLRWPVLAARSLAESVAEYWTEERPAVASKVAVVQFCQDVDELRDAVERMEKQLDRLTATGAADR